MDQRLTSAPRSMNAETFGRQITGVGTDLQSEWSFLGGSRVIIRPQVTKFIRHQKGFHIHASCNLVYYLFHYYWSLPILFVIFFFHQSFKKIGYLNITDFSSFSSVRGKWCLFTSLCIKSLKLWNGCNTVNNWRKYFVVQNIDFG